MNTTENYIHEIASKSDFFSDRPFGESDEGNVTGIYYPVPKYGSDKHCETMREYQQGVEIENIIQYISAHLSDPVTAGDIARRFYISPS